MASHRLSGIKQPIIAQLSFVMSIYSIRNATSNRDRIENISVDKRILALYKVIAFRVLFPQAVIYLVILGLDISRSKSEYSI
jgi:hypothetical protein